MPNPSIFDFNFHLDLPSQEQFPLNHHEQGRTVREILLKDIRASEEYLILAVFTYLVNLIDVLGQLITQNFGNCTTMCLP
jgi:hypothetical protein